MSTLWIEAKTICVHFHCLHTQLTDFRRNYWQSVRCLHRRVDLVRDVQKLQHAADVYASPTLLSYLLEAKTNQTLYRRLSPSYAVFDTWNYVGARRTSS